MPDLSFQVEGAEAVPFAAAPFITLKLRLTNSVAKEAVHTGVLQCQVQIEVTRRHYSSCEQEQLRDLFGEPKRWGETLRNILWTHSSLVVPSFTDSTVVDLQVPCTFDFNIGATKYFHGLKDGEVPLRLMFSGTLFYAESSGELRVCPVPWDREARYRLPVKVWSALMDTYYPNSAWLCLRRDVFERLYQYKVRHGIPTWEQALESILPALEQSV